VTLLKFHCKNIKSYIIRIVNIHYWYLLFPGKILLYGSFACISIVSIVRLDNDLCLIPDSSGHFPNATTYRPALRSMYLIHASRSFLPRGKPA
jgi:hypothetical protein